MPGYTPRLGPKNLDLRPSTESLTDAILGICPGICPVWHVKRCSSCRNGRGAPLTRHRDINAATNILEIYLNLAKFGKRPLVFTRQGLCPGICPAS